MKTCINSLTLITSVKKMIFCNGTGKTIIVQMNVSLLLNAKNIINGFLVGRATINTEVDTSLFT